MRRFITKKVVRYKSHRFVSNNPNAKNIKIQNKQEEKSTDKNMNAEEKIAKIQEVLQEPNKDNEVKQTKRLKKDKSLIERADSDRKVVLTEDDKMLLRD